MRSYLGSRLKKPLFSRLGELGQTTTTLPEWSEPSVEEEYAATGPFTAEDIEAFYEEEWTGPEFVTPEEYQAPYVTYIPETEGEPYQEPSTPWYQYPTALIDGLFQTAASTAQTALAGTTQLVSSLAPVLPAAIQGYVAYETLKQGVPATVTTTTAQQTAQTTTTALTQENVALKAALIEAKAKEEAAAKAAEKGVPDWVWPVGILVVGGVAALALTKK